MEIYSNIHTVDFEKELECSTREGSLILAMVNRNWTERIKLNDVLVHPWVIEHEPMILWKDDDSDIIE